MLCSNAERASLLLVLGSAKDDDDDATPLPFMGVLSLGVAYHAFMLPFTFELECEGPAIDDVLFECESVSSDPAL